MKRVRLLIVDDEAAQRELLTGFLGRSGYDVTQASNGSEALERYREILAPLALVDMKMPGMNGLELLVRLKEINPFVQVIVLTAFGSVDTAVASMRAGAYDYLTKPINDLNELLVKLEKAASQNQLIIDNQVMDTRLAEVFPTTELIGESLAMRRVRELITAVAPREATVLITGSSGTGKELVARAIHANSPRRDKRLVAINCAAFPETLLEAELFGFERGAFTGADKAKQGRFELAEGGTLFLDEIGEIPMAIQVKLLRVIEERRMERLGSVRDTSLDIRIIAATNRDLQILIEQGKFREDLYYRLNVVQIHLPSLSERTGDVLLLAQKFIEKYARKVGSDVNGIEAEAARALVSYSWPGNVRELENVIERALVLARGDKITAIDLSGISSSTTSGSSDRSIRTLASVEKDEIVNCLDQLDWNIGLSAERLGIHRNTLTNKIRELCLIRSNRS